MEENTYTYAVLDSSNIVINKIVATSLEIAELVTEATCIQYDDTTFVEFGYKYNNSDQTFSPVE
jgi:hypothetical protein